MKSKYLVFSVLVISALTLSILPNASAAADCPQAPAGFIPLETPEQFYRVIRDGYTEFDDFGNVFNPHNYYVCNDLDFAGFNYDLPISITGTSRVETSFVQFDGIFTGKLYGGEPKPVIRNLLLNNLTSGHSGQYFGIFLELSNADIQNLAFEDFDVRGRSLVSLLAGQASGSTTLKNIGVHTNQINSQVRAINGTQGQNGDNAALLLALAIPSSNNVVVFDQVLVDNTAPAGANGHTITVQADRGPAGGLVAKLYGGKIRSIQSQSLNVNGVLNSGGVVAAVLPSTDANSVLIEDVHFSGAVRAAHDSYLPRNPCGVAASSLLGCGNAGGIVGLSSTSLQMRRSSAVGTIAGFNYVAGLVARFDNAGAIDPAATEIRNSYSLAELHQLIVSDLDPISDAGGVAGLVGFLRGTVRASYSAAPLLQSNGLAPRAGLVLQNGNSSSSTPAIDTGLPSYYDRERVDVPENGLGAAATTAALQTPPNVPGSLFINWDGTVWNFANGEYPRHQPFNSQMCAGDIDRNGEVTLQDLFSFLDAWFGQTAAADVNQDGNITLQDLFDFLTHWFARC